jgi:hypothetical protein
VTRQNLRTFCLWLAIVGALVVLATSFAGFHPFRIFQGLGVAALAAGVVLRYGIPRKAGVNGKKRSG